MQGDAARKATGQDADWRQGGTRSEARPRPGDKRPRGLWPGRGGLGRGEGVRAGPELCSGLRRAQRGWGAGKGGPGVISGSHSGCGLDGGWIGQEAGVRLAPPQEQGGRKEGAGEGLLEEPGWAQRLAALLRAVAGRLKAASQV